MATASSLPDFFAPLLAEQYEPSDVQRILDGCSATRPVTLRANTLLASREEVASALDDAGIAYEPVEWYGDAFVIRDAREKALWDLPVYQEGKVYLQSLSSMIPALVLDAQPGEDVCDMCAAPGGKTTQIAALANNKAYITACEMHAPRAEKLEYNLRKLGTASVTVMRVDSRNLDEFFSFDRILLDAPCSGSGTVKAGDPRTAKRFTEALVRKSQKSQKALLLKALNALKPGGTLVYSTCSVLACENEDVVEHCLRQVRRKGTFELQPVIQERPEGDDADGAGRGEQDESLESGAACGGEPAELPSAAFSSDDAKAFPLLPTRLQGALCIAPTDLYEGFFVAKIKRTK